MRITVESQGSGPHLFYVSNDERLLHAGLAQGLCLPYECGTGTCGQCRAVLAGGTVSDLWPDAPGNRFRRRERNEILMCQSRANSDCVLHLLPARTNLSANPYAPNQFKGCIEASNVLCSDVIRLTIDLGRNLKALPGQFVLLEAAGIEGPRAYSLTTSERATQLDLLIRRKRGGLLTEWLFSPTCIGQPIKVFGPIGRSVFRTEADKDLLLVAGGTGVASTIAILRAAIKAGHFEFHKAKVFFGVRTPADVFYLSELQALLEIAPPGAVTINVCFSHSSAQSVAPSGLQFRNGFIHEIVKEDLSEINLALATAFLSGPAPMIEAMITTLIKAKLPTRQIRYDKFS